MIRNLTIAAIAALVLPGALGAEEGKEKKHKAPNDYSGVLGQHDTDKDGVLSAAEMGAITDEKLKEKLKGFDKDGDGALSKEEGETAKAEWKPKKEKKEKKEGEEAK